MTTCSTHINSVSKDNASFSAAPPPKWCPELQIYIDGTIDQSSAAQSHIDHVLSNKLPLYVFGYGSLCWNPGDGILSHPKVSKMLGRAVGYQRCWGQKSADHRGHIFFPGLVCTLLSDEEVRTLQREHVGLLGDDDDDGDDHGENGNQKEDDPKVSLTEGLVYTIPHELIQQCLDELDFREKGGYARDLIDVVVFDDMVDQEQSGCTQEVVGKQKRTIKAILYRGTPDNPAFSRRALLDEIYSAAIMSIAQGPSGDNYAYLHQLNEFLVTATSSAGFEDELESFVGDTRTGRLTALSKFLQEHQLYFLFGGGSNQYNQLLLESSTKHYYNAAKLVNGEEAHELKEIVLIVPKGPKHLEEDTRMELSVHRPKKLFAGGGHSALLTHYGNFYIWGWNESNQLGRSEHGMNDSLDHSIHELGEKHPIVPPLDIKVETAALGHNHTLIIEKDTGYLYAFGDDNRGQVSGESKIGRSTNDSVVIQKLDLGRFVDVAAGLFHSAAITIDGELVTFGCGRYGQSLSSMTEKDVKVGRWKPDDGSRLVKVACGRRHTVVLDEHGRVYTMGENKYNQLGRTLPVDTRRDQNMKLVDGFLGEKGSGCIGIDCGWSHTIAIVETSSGDGIRKLYGWGRNDKGQLSFDRKETSIVQPREIVVNSENVGIKDACCGSESLSVLDHNNDILSCGWNEHGNLAVGHSSDIHNFSKVSGARLCTPFHGDIKENGRVLLASGGAHLLTTIVSNHNHLTNF
jgi:alpha-tubulin suppressor-like RCC1 family protein/cation transport regulator ChaC